MQTKNILFSPFSGVELNESGCRFVIDRAGYSTNRLWFMPMPNNTAAHAGFGVTVIAAGLLRGDGAYSGPVYNGLKIHAVNSGELVINFDGYSMPDDQLQYVVKIMPANSTARASLLSVYFIEYIPEGIRLNVRRGNANLGVADLQSAQFMIEVSSIQ